MSDPRTPPVECRLPRCRRCGATLVRAALPPGSFGIEGEGCADCNDWASAKPTAWACPACGGVWLLEADGA